MTYDIMENVFFLTIGRYYIQIFQNLVSIFFYILHKLFGHFLYILPEFINPLQITFIHKFSAIMGWERFTNYVPFGGG